MEENPAGQGMLSNPELAKDQIAPNSKQDWKSGELQLRQQEVRYTRHSLWVGAITAIATAAAAVSAAVAVIFAGKAVNIAQMAIASQAKEARFSTAVEALGGDQPTKRVAGAIMLRHNVEDRFASAQNAQDQTDAANLYVTTTAIFETYLKTPAEPPSSATPTVPLPVTASGENPPVGAPAVRPARLGTSLEHMYVAQQLAGLLNKHNQDLFHRFDNPRIVSIDLSYVELSRQNWPNVDFSWMSGAYLYGIDLRGANLTNSKWGAATLTAASFQCADLTNSKLIGAHLQDAKLQHANLHDADLRSADLTGADLTGAYLDGARFDGAVRVAGVIGARMGDGKLLQDDRDPNRGQYDRATCIKNGWDQ